MASKKYYASLVAIFSLVATLGLYNVDRGLKNLNPDFRKKAKTEHSLEASILNRTPEQSAGLLKQILENPLKSDEGILYNANSVDKIIESHGESLENSAYKNILSHRKELEKIVSEYKNVGLPLVMAVLKVENSSFNNDRSKAGAVGRMQVLYNGSYSFLWNALLSNDPYFTDIRSEYENPLNEILSELNKNNVLVKGKQGKQKTWKNLKAYFRSHPSLNEKIGTLYLDFLIGKFGDVEKALAAYNAGETRVRNANGVPNIKETQLYVEGVMKAAEVFSDLLKNPYIFAMYNK